MAKLRHVAMSVPDPAATAKFYCDTFDMKIVGETDSPLASGIYLQTALFRLRYSSTKQISGREWTRTEVH